MSLHRRQRMRACGYEVQDVLRGGRVVQVLVERVEVRNIGDVAFCRRVFEVGMKAPSGEEFVYLVGAGEYGVAAYE